MAQIDFSLQNRIPDGNGKLLVGDLSPTDGSYTTEQQYLEWMKGKILYSGYLYNGDFYKEAAHTNVIGKVDGAIYVDLSDGTNLSLYYCDNTTYKALTEEAQVQAIRTELANGTLVPLKATQDSLGNQIDTTYAKKSDLQDGTIVVKEAEIATKDEDGNNIKATYETKADASDLKSAIDRNSQRIENLEVAVSGSLVQTNTDATMANTKVITNANSILPWAILKRVGARAIAWNQQMTVATWTNPIVQNGVTLTNNGDGSFTLNGTATADTTFSNVTNPLARTGKTYWLRGAISGVTLRVPYGSANDTGSGAVMTVSTDNITELRVLVANGASFNNAVFYPQFTDLTIMGMASYTASQLKALFPASYYPYDAGHAYGLNPSAFKVVGKQKWDEQWEVGSINSSGGNGTATNCIRSKNYVPVIGGTTYYFETGFTSSGGFPIFSYYDANKLFISQENKSKNDSFVVPVGASFLRFQVESSYGTSYNHNIMICLNSVTDKTYEAYSETTIDTSDVPEGYVDSEHYNYKENVLMNGVMRGAIHPNVIRTKVMKGTDGGWSYEHHDGYDLFYYNITRTENCLPNYYKPSSGNEVPIMADGANAVSRNALTDVSGSTVNVAIQAGVSSFLMFCTPSSMNLTSSALFNAWLADHNVTIRYRTREDTQTVTYTEPFPNIPVEDGTTVTAVTPQTDLVNAIDVPSTIAYMTKISS